MTKQAPLTIKSIILSPQLAVMILVFVIHCWQFIEADFGQALLPKTFHSDAGFYHFAAWFNAFIDHGGYISDVLSISPYRWILTQWYQITGSVPYSPFLLNALLSALSGVILVSLSALIFDKKTAWLSAFLFAFSAQLLFFSGIAGKTILVLFLFSLAVYLACLYFYKGQRQYLVFATLVSLLASIDRPNVLVILIALFLIILLRANIWALKKRLIDVALILLITFTAQLTSKWYFGEEPAYYSPVGLNIYLGHSQPNRWSLKVEGIRNNIIGHRLDSVAAAEQRSGQKLSKVEASQYWIRQAIEYAKTNPKQYANTQIQKMAALFSPTSIGLPEQLLVNREKQSALKITFIDFAWLYALAGVFFVSIILKNWFKENQPYPQNTQPTHQVEQVQISLLLLALLGYVASILLTFVVERYRLPLLVFLVPFAAAGLSALVSTQNKIVRITLIATFIGFFCASHLSQIGIPYGYGWADDIPKKAFQKQKQAQKSTDFYMAAKKTLDAPTRKDCRTLQISSAKRFYKNDHKQLVKLCNDKLKKLRHARRNRSR